MLAGWLACFKRQYGVKNARLVGEADGGKLWKNFKSILRVIQEKGNEKSSFPTLMSLAGLQGHWQMNLYNTNGASVNGNVTSNSQELNPVFFLRA